MHIIVIAKSIGDQHFYELGHPQELVQTGYYFISLIEK